VTTWTSIASLDAPTAGIFDFPGLTLTGYQVLEIVASEIIMGTDATHLCLRYSVAAAVVTAGYRWYNIPLEQAGGSNDGDASDPFIALGGNNTPFLIGNASGESASVIVRIDAPLSTAHWRMASFRATHVSADGTVVATSGGGILETTSALDGFRLLASSGNLTAGKVRILGMA
jgi:hypothetical protein